MTFQKYFGKKTKFMIATIAAIFMAILLGTGCRIQPGYVPDPCVWPGFENVYTILVLFIAFSMFAWPGIGLYYLVKFIRTRKITKTSD